MRRLAALASIVSLALMAGCKREQRIFDPGALGNQPASENNLRAAGMQGDLHPMIYEESAYAVGEGKRLFEEYNCSGCHQHGGGGIGPALMDSEWIYGSRPNQIYADIVDGRPNGMPSFGGKLPEYQVWELVAYVRSLSGQLPADIAPSRSDEMPVAKAEQARPKEHPRDKNQPIEQGQP